METVDAPSRRPQPSPSAERPLAGRAGLVTGAARGIGAATAVGLAGAGAAVVLADVDAAALADTAARCRAIGASVTEMVVDVSSRAGAHAAVDAVVDNYGRIDLAYNNVGATGPAGTLDELTPDAWERAWRLNVESTVWCMQREIATMRDAGAGGVIVNAASTAGLGPLPRLPAYVAAKHAVIGLTKAAAIDHGPDGIRVVAVCPGPTDTPLLRAAIGDDPAALAARAASTPLGRVGVPGDVAAVVVWLCTDAAAFVTGETIRVDGGRRA